jgi:hypothetical protein
MPVVYNCSERNAIVRAQGWPNAVASIRNDLSGEGFNFLESQLIDMKTTHPTVRWVYISNSVFVEYPAGYTQFRIDALGHLVLNIGEY